MPERLRQAASFMPLLALLALAWPFLNFADVNRTMLGGPQLARLLLYFFTAVAVLLSAWGVLHLLGAVRRRSRQLDAAIAIMIAVMFMFAPLMNVIAWVFGTIGLQRGGMLAYVGVWVVSGLAMYWLARYRNARQILGAFLLVAVAFPAVNYLIFLAQPRPEEAVAVITENMADAPFQERPNVYFLIMDQYARSDRLEQYFGASDTQFLAGLEQRGFLINRDFFANYPTTFLSISSTLQMDYLALPERQFSDRSTFVNAIVGSGEVYEQFRRQGYAIANASSKITSAGCQGNEDFCLDAAGARLGELEFGLLNLTPFGVGLERWALRYLPPRTLDTFESAIGSLPASRPIFHFIHTSPPHVPFFMTDACAAGPLSESDPDVTSPEMREAYVTSVHCAGQGALKFIDFVTQRDPDAIIVLQSDHGAGQTVDWLLPAAQWTREQAAERLAAFSAIRAPGRCGADVARLRTAVNTFRVVLACLEGRPTEWLEDRLFIGSYETVADFGLVREVHLLDEEAP